MSMKPLEPRYGRWNTVSRDGGHALCVCDCGTSRRVSLGNLRNGASRSCGCLRNESNPVNGRKSLVHGAKGTGAYRAWRSMRDRCHNPRNPSYADYGGRGITVCERWRVGEGEKSAFVCFLEDVGHRPSGNHSLDRIDNDAGYGPGNCRWATSKQQSRNRRSNAVVRWGDREMSLVEAAELVGLPYGCLWRRLGTGKWTVEKAMTTPLRPWARGRPATPS
jgi:hypothetical protein